MQCPYCKEEIKDEAIKCKYCKVLIGAINENYSNHTIEIASKQRNDNYINPPISFISDVSKIRIWVIIIFVGCVVMFVNVIGSYRANFIDFIHLFSAMVIIILMPIILYISYKKEFGIYVYDKDIKIEACLMPRNEFYIDIDKIISISKENPLRIVVSPAYIRRKQYNKNTIDTFFENTFTVKDYLLNDDGTLKIPLIQLSDNQVKELHDLIQEKKCPLHHLNL